VQIAFANEVALICEAVGGDAWKVRELVNKSPGRQMLLPGAGVGGHCIPKDPWLLAYGAPDRALHLIPAARAVNSSMPIHMAELLDGALKEAGQILAGARILVLGYAYLEGADDIRNSPSETLVNELHQRAAVTVIHDPYVPEFDGSLEEKALGCNAAVLMVRHPEYLALDLEQLKSWLAEPVLVDGRRAFDPETVQQAGWIYRGIGWGG
jgi:UDP-N-acetyl-D-mannosaminuronic acid dehydrogenase